MLDSDAHDILKGTGNARDWMSAYTYSSTWSELFKTRVCYRNGFVDLKKRGIELSLEAHHIFSDIL